MGHVVAIRPLVASLPAAVLWHDGGAQLAQDLRRVQKLDNDKFVQGQCFLARAGDPGQKLRADVIDGENGDHYTCVSRGGNEAHMALGLRMLGGSHASEGPNTPGPIALSKWRDFRIKPCRW